MNRPLPRRALRHAVPVVPAVLAITLFAANAPAQLAWPNGLQLAPIQSRLVRTDAPILPSALPDPSVANTFNFVTPTGVPLNGIGAYQTPDPSDPLHLFDTCTTERIGPATIIMAAHCVTDENTGALLSTSALGRAFFMSPAATNTSPVYFDGGAPTSILVNPDWKGFDNPLTPLEDDIAIVNLGHVLPSFVTTYSFYTGDPVGQEATEVGIGTFGGPVGPEDFDFGRRWGTNTIDFQTGFFGFPDLFTDFDDPAGNFDVFCFAVGICNGSTQFEASTAPGDSGGPLFVDGKIAGITSFGTAFCDPQFLPQQCVPFMADPNREGFDSYGAINGFAPILPNLAFIRASIAPEPSTIVLVTTGFLALLVFTRRRTRMSRTA